MTDKGFEKTKQDRLMQWILGIITTYRNSYSGDNVPIEELIKECEDIGMSKVKSSLEMYGIHYDFQISLTRNDDKRYGDWKPEEAVNPEYNITRVKEFH